MMLKTKGRYAVMAVLDLASNGLNKPVNLSDLAKRQNIAQNYLEQIFLQLRKSEIVKSVRGPGGGYILSQDPRNISIKNVIESVGEGFEMNRCKAENKKSCMPNNIKCNSHHLWQGLTHIISGYLEKITIYDVINGENLKNSFFSDCIDHKKMMVI